MNFIKQDQLFFTEAAAVLKDYLLSDALFWPVTGLPARSDVFQIDRLTPGNLRLAQLRLAAQPSRLPSGFRLDDLNAQVESVQTAWQTAWQRKCSQEWKQRLGDWMSFLDEALRQPAAHGQEYHFKIRWRVILELIRDDVSRATPGPDSILPGIDARLASRFQAGDFLWTPELAPAFPAPKFWFLYGTLTIARQS